MAKFLRRFFKSESSSQSEIETVNINEGVDEQQDIESRKQAIKDKSNQIFLDRNKYIDRYMNSDNLIDKSSDVEALDEMLLKPNGAKGYMSDMDKYEALSKLMETERFRDELATWVIDGKNNVAQITVQCPGSELGKGIKGIKDSKGGCYEPLGEFSTDTLKLRFRRDNNGDFDIVTMEPDVTVPTTSPTGRNLSSLLDKCPNYHTDKPGERTLYNIRTNPEANMGVSYFRDSDSLDIRRFRNIQWDRHITSEVAFQYVIQPDEIFEKMQSVMLRRSNGYMYPISSSTMQHECQQDESLYEFAHMGNVMDNMYKKVQHEMAGRPRDNTMNHVAAKVMHIGDHMTHNMDYSDKVDEINVSM